MKLLFCILITAFFCTACNKTNSTSSTDKGLNEEIQKAGDSVSNVAMPSPTVPEAPLGPTSIADITPGKTTIEELKNLIVEPSKDDYVSGDEVTPKKLEKSTTPYMNGRYSARLRGLNKKTATIYINNGVVYKLTLSLFLDEEAISSALFEKYGKPTIKEGAIIEVTCTNGFGASFQRPAGEEKLQWKPNLGIRAYIRSIAGDCKNNIFKSYIIEDISTLQALDAEKTARKAKEISEKVEKIRGGI